VQGWQCSITTCRIDFPALGKPDQRMHRCGCLDCEWTVSGNNAKTNSATQEITGWHFPKIGCVRKSWVLAREGVSFIPNCVSLLNQLETTIYFSHNNKHSDLKNLLPVPLSSGHLQSLFLRPYRSGSPYSTDLGHPPLTIKSKCAD
jgi:hypothetical protein